jgi:rRNA maturation protein Nop10
MSNVECPKCGEKFAVVTVGEGCQHEWEEHSKSFSSALHAPSYTYQIKCKKCGFVKDTRT